MASEENIGKLYRIAQEEHGERINYESFRESLMRSISADLDIDEMIIKMLESSEGVSIGTYKNGVFVFSNEVIKTAEKLVIEDAKKKDIYETDDKIDVDVTKEIIKETKPKESRVTGFAEMSFEQQLELIYDYAEWTIENVKEVQEERDSWYENLPNNPNLTPEQKKSAERVVAVYKNIENDAKKSFDIYLKGAQNFQEILFSNASEEEKRKKYEEYLAETRKMLEENLELLQKSDASDKQKNAVYERLAVATGMKTDDIREAIQEFGYDVDEWVDTLANFVMTPVYKTDFETARNDSIRWNTYGAIETAKAVKFDQSVKKIFEKPGMEFTKEEQVEALFALTANQQKQIIDQIMGRSGSRFDDMIMGMKIKDRSTGIRYAGELPKLELIKGAEEYGDLGQYILTPPKETRIFKMLDGIRTVGTEEVSDSQEELLVTDKEFGDRLMANISKPLYQDITFTERVLRTPQTIFPTTYKSSTETLEAVLKKNDKIPMAGLPGLKYTPTNVTRFNPLVVETMVVDTEPLKPIQPKTKTVQETPVPPVIEEVVTEPIEEPYVSKPNMSEANVVPTPPAAEVVEPENVQEEPETALPANITLGDKLKRGFNALGDKMKAVFAAIVSNDKSKGLFARVSDALAGSAGSSDATSTSSTSSAGQGKEAQVVDYLNQHFDINVKAARDAAIASQEAATKETKAVDEKGDETK